MEKFFYSLGPSGNNIGSQCEPSSPADRNIQFPKGLEKITVDNVHNNNVYDKTPLPKHRNITSLVHHQVFRVFSQSLQANSIIVP
jgi:hypothetical protein